MVMYITEELLYPDEKLISREDDDGIIAQYNNVRLTCPAEDKHCACGDVSYVWRIPLKIHCPLYHVRKFKGQMIRYCSVRIISTFSLSPSLVRDTRIVPDGQGVGWPDACRCLGHS